MIYFGKPKNPVTNRLSAFHHVTIGAGASGDTGIEPMPGIYRAQALADRQTLIQKTAQERVSHVTIGAGAGGDTGIEPMPGIYRAQILDDSSLMLQKLIQKTAQEMITTYSNASTIADSDTGV